MSSFYKALTGAPQIGITGLGTSAQNATQINTANTQAAAQVVQGLIQSMGSVAGAAVAACWIARRLYGYSPDYYYARFYIFTQWDGWLARLCKRLYSTYGQRISRSRMLVTLLKPLFDLAVTRGRAAFYGK